MKHETRVAERSLSVRANVISGVFEYRGSRYDAVICETPDGPVLTVLNFNTCMELPTYWREGLATGYLHEKLGCYDQLNEVDAEGIRQTLELIARKER